MLHAGYNTFIEIGPHPLLLGGIKTLLAKLRLKGFALPAMRRFSSNFDVFWNTVGEWVAHGGDYNSLKLLGRGHQRLKLPPYPWQSQAYWFEASESKWQRLEGFTHPFLKSKRSLIHEEGQGIWENRIGVRTSPFLQDHQVNETIVFPGSGQIELAYAVARETYPHTEVYLEDIHFVSPLVLPNAQQSPLKTRLEFTSNEGDYILCHAPEETLDSQGWTIYGRGRINHLDQQFISQNLDLKELQAIFRDDNKLDVEAFYQALDEVGLNYGSRFCCVRELWATEDHVLARLELDSSLLHENQFYYVHPALLDAGVHADFAARLKQGGVMHTFLPYALEKVKVHRSVPSQVWAYIKVLPAEQNLRRSDIWLLDQQGQICVELQGFTRKRLGSHYSLADKAIEQYDFSWQPQSLEPLASKSALKQLLIFSSDSLRLQPLFTEIKQHQPELEIHSFSLDCQPEQALEGLSLTAETSLLFFPGRLPLKETDSAEQFEKGFLHGPQQLLTLGRYLIAQESRAKVNVLTQRHFAVRQSKALFSANQASLEGITKVLLNECPHFEVRLIDVPDPFESQDLKNLAKLVLAEKPEWHHAIGALRQSDYFVQVLEQVDSSPQTQTMKAEEGSYRARQETVGVLDSMVFQEIPETELEPHEVEVSVKAAGINFKDIMKAMHLLDKEAVKGGLSDLGILGGEVSGRVRRMGSAVDDLKIGDPVMARVAGGFAGRVKTPRACVGSKPDSLNWAESAVVPVVYLTAYYSLYHLARLEEGESILIHSASGGVGIAAVQLAQRRGCQIIATAGSEVKRDYLRKELGIRHVFDSRSLNFYDELMRVTQGQGVDIVLNSLSGAFMTQSLKCLASFGRFIELGKTDIYNNSKLNLKRLAENISYFVVDLDRLALQKPTLHQEMLADIVAYFKRES